jgi:hypothetical protein
LVYLIKGPVLAALLASCATAVFTIDGDQCGGDPNAAETFNARDPNACNNGNLPMPIPRQLPRDLATRTVQASGGTDKLCAEIKLQKIDFDTLSPELHASFRPCFPAA